MYNYDEFRTTANTTVVSIRPPIIHPSIAAFISGSKAHKNNINTESNKTQNVGKWKDR